MKDIVQFFHEVRSEMARVVWPKWNDLVGSTVVVMLIVIAFSIYLFLIDLGFSKLARLVFKSYGMF